MDGGLIATYVYDAWGNHKVCNADRSENKSKSFIGNQNPFRYRGYYYDTETKLYYLQTRYYDPELGRFINADSIDYLNPEAIGGLNLYSYCQNNPVMFTDPLGCSVFLTMLLIGIFAGAAIGGAMNGISAYNEGQRGWGLFGSIAGGAIMGGAMGAALVLGGAAGLSAAIAPLGLSVAGFTGVLTTGAALGISIGVGVGAGMVSYSLENCLRSDRQWTAGGFIKSGFSGGIKALSTFGIGYLGGKMGGFDKMLLNPILKGASTLSTSITYNITKVMLSQVIPSVGRTLFTRLSMVTGEMLAKMLIFSSLGSGARWFIDWIFGN